MAINETRFGTLPLTMRRVLRDIIDNWLPSSTMSFTNKTLSSCTINNTITPLTTQSTEHGIGAIGTYMAPVTKRGTLEDGSILTQIQVDLTGLACKGDAANDVIGLSAGGAAYIGRYVTSTCGILYRAEVICVETPTEGTATITTDIDIAFNSSAALAYDGAAGAAEFDVGGLAAGNIYTLEALALTANDYIYLVEGDAAATTGVYSGGQIIIQLYGHATL